MSILTGKILMPCRTVKAKTIAAFLAIAGAVAVPQLFHMIGAVSGLGTALGETFLPMHLPILLVGMLAGPFAGAAAGLCGPLVSYLLTGMPGAVMLPFMMLELCAYGVAAGCLAKVKIPCIAKLLAAQIVGRAVRALAVLIAVYAMGNTGIAVSSIWMSVKVGLPGILLQWALLPLIMYRIGSVQEK